MREDTEWLSVYLEQIKNLPLPTKSQEREAAERVQAGIRAEAELSANGVSGKHRQELESVIAEGQAARQTLIEGCLRWVVALARNYQVPGASLGDVIQLGNIGLMQAIDLYNPDTGFRLTTYASFWIKQSIRRGLADITKTIRVPQEIGNQQRRVQNADAELFKTLHRSPTVQEIAELAHLPETTVVAHQGIPSTSSFNVPSSDDGEEYVDSFADLETSEFVDRLCDYIDAAPVLSALSDIPERQRQVLELRYGFDRGHPRTFREVAEMLGVSCEAIRKSERRGLKHLREIFGAEAPAI